MCVCVRYTKYSIIVWPCKSRQSWDVKPKVNVKAGHLQGQGQGPKDLALRPSINIPGKLLRLFALSAILIGEVQLVVKGVI